ncbi:MAG: efflux RND transporter permease subunit [Firmicutes bacterium]|nr:efflux RND transporter permease subunit [Bacillota bacterium]
MSYNQDNYESVKQKQLDGNIKENPLSRFGVRRPHTIIVALIITIVLGVFSLTMLRTELFPDMDLPFAMVVVTRDFDAIPDGQTIADMLGEDGEWTVETSMSFSREVQAAIASVIGVHEVTSLISAEMVMFAIEFNQGTDIDLAQINLFNAINRINLGARGFASPIVMGIDLDMMPILAFTTTHIINYTQADITYARDNILPGVLAELGLAETALTLAGANLTNANDIYEWAVEQFEYFDIIAGQPIPDGFADAQAAMLVARATLAEAQENYNIAQRYVTLLRAHEDYLDNMRVGGINWAATRSWFVNILEPELRRINGVASVSIPFPDNLTPDERNFPFLIGEPDTFAFLNGERAFSVSIQKSAEAATTDVARAVLARLDYLINNQSQFEGFTYTVSFNQAQFISDTIGEVGLNMVLGGVFAILIILLFLRNVRATIAIAISIPLSIIGAFVLMYFMGIGLNMVSMGGFALAVGMLTDNSIIVLENIYRLRQKGMSLLEACIKGSSQIFGAVLAATLTTIAVFFPLFFVEGLIVSMFMDMVWVVIISLGASLIVAIAALPSILNMLKFKPRDKKPTEEKSEFGQRVDKVSANVRTGFNTALNWTVKNKLTRGAVIGGAFVLLIVSFFGTWFAHGLTLMPTTDEGQFSVTVSTNNTGYGTSLATLGDPALQTSIFNERAREVASGRQILKRDEAGNVVQDAEGNDQWIIDPQNRGLHTEITALLGRDLQNISISLGGGIMGLGGGGLNISIILSDNRSRTTAQAAEATYLLVRNYLTDRGLMGNDPRLNVGSGYVGGVPAPIWAGGDGTNTIIGMIPVTVEDILNPEGQAYAHRVTVLPVPPPVAAGLPFPTPSVPTITDVPFGQEVTIDPEAFSFMGMHITLVSMSGYSEGGEFVRWIEGRVTMPFGLDGSNFATDVSFSASQMDMLASEVAVVSLVGTTPDITHYQIFEAIELIQARIEASSFYARGDVLRITTNFDERTIIQINGNTMVNLEIVPREGVLAADLTNSVNAIVDELFGSNDPEIRDLMGRVQRTPAGFEQMINDTIPQLVLAIIVGMLLVYLVMVAIFKSFLAPFVIMMVIPLAFTGGFLALLFTFNPISVVALMGFLVLTGLIVNNGIVLVDYANQLREDGLSVKDAIVAAANVRARPIFITALSTVGALLPNAIIGDPLMAPMAIVAVGGILFATLMTLLVIPALYKLVYRDPKGVCDMTREEQEAVLVAPCDNGGSVIDSDTTGGVETANGNESDWNNFMNGSADSDNKEQ